MGGRKIWTLVAFFGFLGCFLQTKRKWGGLQAFFVFMGGGEGEGVVMMVNMMVMVMMMICSEEEEDEEEGRVHFCIV